VHVAEIVYGDSTLAGRPHWTKEWWSCVQSGDAFTSHITGVNKQVSGEMVVDKIKAIVARSSDLPKQKPKNKTRHLGKQTC
jgi:hypothetical protein